ncbi:MAG: hypothetical protein QF797_06095, partial [Alphaproteobacteria bacterium]|nr:hypothetical protein [Alphaproteobacteria bacterium]
MTELKSEFLMTLAAPGTMVVGEATYRLVADFEARILEEARAEDGAVWFTLGGRTAQGRDFTLEISAADFAEERKLKAALLRAAGA